MTRVVVSKALCSLYEYHPHREPRPNRLRGRDPVRRDQERPGRSVPARPPQSQPFRGGVARWPAQFVARLAAAQQHGRVMVRDTAAVLHQRRSGQHGDVAVRESAHRAPEVRPPQQHHHPIHRTTTRPQPQPLPATNRVANALPAPQQHVGVPQYAALADGRSRRRGAGRRGPDRGGHDGRRSGHRCRCAAAGDWASGRRAQSVARKCSFY